MSAGKFADLPVGWSGATLPELIGQHGLLSDGDWVESKDQNPKGEVRLTQLADIGDGTFRDRSRRFLTATRAQELSCTPLASGDLLIARMPDPLGRACIFPGATHQCVTAVDVCIMRPGNPCISNRWLMHFINSPVFRASVSQLQSGSTRKRISKANLCTIKLPVPPSAEQGRIADAVDSHLSRLDDAEATLERVKRNLERYRASVLQAAVEGHLVTTDAEVARLEGRPFESAESLLSRTTRKSPIQAEDDGSGNRLHALPTGWSWTKLESILAEPLVNGRSVQTAEVGFPVLRLTALKDGTIDLAERKVGAWTADEAAGCLVMRDDFFVARGNGSIRLVGRGGLVLEDPDPVAFPDTFIRIRAREDVVNLRFLSYVWNSHVVRRYVERRAKTTAGIHKVNQADLAATPFPLPPREEQDRVVEVLDRAFSIAEFLRKQVERGSCSVARLRQAVLSWAFQGRLVDQDPSDEPATFLLERIRAERTKAAPSPATPRRRGRPRKAVKK